MRNRLAVIALLSVLCIAAGPAKQPAMTKEAKVRKLIELTAGENLARQMIDAMVAQVQQAGLDPRLGAKIRELAAKEDIVSMYVPVYLKHLDEKDIDAAIAFYSSPSGKRMVAAQPAVLQDSMAIGNKWGRDLAERAQREVAAENAK